MTDSFLPATPFDNPVLIFALVMLIILVARILFKKIKIPGIVGLILAGTLVGPGLLGLLERDFTIELLGTVGLLYLMFMAGLSIDLNQFEKLRGKSIGFGLISFLIPQLAAVYVGTELFDYSLSTSFLLGSIVGSHTLLAYPIIEKLGITKNQGVTMAMGATLVTDMLSLGILAIVAATVGESSGTGYWLGFSASVMIFIAGALVIIPRLGRWFFRNMKYERNIDYVFVVAVLFITAFLAEAAGLAPIIGAFMAGLLLNRLVPESGTLMSRVQFVGNVFFIPFFLISVGMLVDVSVLANLDVWIKAAAFSLLVFTGKGAASVLATYMFKHSRDEGWVIFGLTTPQSAATLAVTLIGFDLGFFDSTAVNAVVMMILVTCLVGPYVAERFGRKVAVADAEKPYKPSDAPQRILVPLANPETSDELLNIAFMVRDEKMDQPIYPLTVAKDGARVEENVARGEKMLSHAVIYAASAEVPINPITRVDLNVAKGISRAVNEQRITKVIVGWNGRNGARNKIFGTILDQLLGEIDELLMVCKIEKPVNTFSRIIVAIPPYATMETGFYEAMKSIKTMAEQMALTLSVITTSEREQILQDTVENIDPKVDVEYNAIDSWGQLPNTLDNIWKADDLFVLMSTRPGTISWRPALDKLPGLLAQKYPTSSFITIYPSERSQTFINREGTGEVSQLFSSKRIRMGIESTEIESALLEMVAADDEVFGTIDRKRITKRLLDNSSDFTPEVMPGVVFFDSHTSKVSKQVLYVGISEPGIRVPNTANPANVVLLLLSPKEISVEGHLESVTRVVKIVRSPGQVQKLKDASSAKQALQILGKIE
jgi:Kef-type K+ transport system membrane component KefB/mannitol/fructose-specific phosphotransferase system IIA component (Ntr-type)